MAVASAGPLYASLTSLQTDNHASTPPLSFLQAGCPSCRPTNSVKALKAFKMQTKLLQIISNYIQEADRFILKRRVQWTSVSELRHGENFIARGKYIGSPLCKKSKFVTASKIIGTIFIIHFNFLMVYCNVLRLQCTACSNKDA